MRSQGKAVIKRTMELDDLLNTIEAMAKGNKGLRLIITNLRWSTRVISWQHIETQLQQPKGSKNWALGPGLNAKAAELQIESSTPEVSHIKTKFWLGTMEPWDLG